MASIISREKVREFKLIDSNTFVFKLEEDYKVKVNSLFDFRENSCETKIILITRFEEDGEVEAKVIDIPRRTGLIKVTYDYKYGIRRNKTSSDHTIVKLNTPEEDKSNTEWKSLPECEKDLTKKNKKYDKLIKIVQN